MEMIGKLSDGDQIREAHITFKKLPILSIISTLLMTDMMQKMLFPMVIFIKIITPQLY